MSDLDAAIQRLGAGIPNLGDLNTVIAAAKRPPLTDATREQLIDLIHSANEGYADPARAAADAILAEYRPVVSTRERMADALRDSKSDDDRIDDLFKSGAVEDRAAVEAKALEAAAADIFFSSVRGRNTAYGWLRVRAASIREGRS